MVEVENRRGIKKKKEEGVCGMSTKKKKTQTVSAIHAETPKQGEQMKQG
jgi:putative methionine-R-sulfoxide reductase with GAF domain